MTNIPQSAAAWALEQLGCPYSQARRTQEGVFDCSSLVARAYSAQGKRWRHGGSVPVSMYEVYDDEFELLWPEDYADIGACFGGNSVINLARQSGDLQFICTDSSTGRSNKITHVAMVADANTLVHARGMKYGVCTNSINLYSGKICAVVRYNPTASLRTGMCGWMTLALQHALNANGADIVEDGEFGEKTRNAVIACQQSLGLDASGIADAALLERLELVESTVPEVADCVEVTGNSVNVRIGPGVEYDATFIAHKGDCFSRANTDGWTAICFDNSLYWISDKYIR